MVDSHCHLDQPQFEGDRDEVVDRAVGAGVQVMINPGVDLASSRRALELADRHPEVYAAVGVHPNECGAFDESDVEALRELAQHPKVVAIGEIGLDFHWKQVVPSQQERALRAQLVLAVELNLPVILHSRESNAVLLQLISKWCPMALKHSADDIIGVWHAFSGDLREAQTAFSLGLAVGIGGPITFRNARSLQRLAPQLRKDRLMLETDAPYLAPSPMRGRRNEPAHLPLIARSLAGFVGVEPVDIIAASDAAIERCFGRMA